MSIETLKGSMQTPGGICTIQVSSLTNVTLDAASEAVGFVFIAPRSANLRKFLFITATVTTGATLQGGVYAVDLATGLPTGAALATISQVVGNADDNVAFLCTLSVDVALTAGTAYVLVVANPASSHGTMNIRLAPGNSVSWWWGPSYVVSYLGAPPSAWAKHPVSGPWATYIEYDDGTTDNIGSIPAILSNVTFNNASATRERALYFRFPAPVAVRGALISGTWGGNGDVILYDSDGTTPLATRSIDKDLTHGLSTGVIIADFGAGVELAANTFYRLSLKPTTTTDLTIVNATFLSTAVMEGVDMGTDAYLSTRDSGGAWTETTTQRLMISLLVSGIEGGGGAAGMLYKPGMSGGVQ